MSAPLQAVIVGGSLAGLASAVALADRGLSVTVLERSARTPAGGGAVGVDPQHLYEVAGLPPRPGASGLEAESWQSLHSRLLEAAESRSNVHVRHGHTASAVGQAHDAAWARTAEGTIRGDILIGADGHRSIVRGVVDPDRPDATFAGYGLWLGIAREGDLPPVHRWPQWPDILDGADAKMIGYPLEGENGSRTPGERRLGWAWFDASRNPFLRESGAVRDGVVRHSLRASSLPSSVLAGLRQDASAWPEPWRSAVRDTIDRRDVTGVPIAEYVPRRLVRGRIALAGNAAHVPTPMTGRGFDTSLDDAAVLAELLSSVTTADAVAALEEYERRRLPDVAAMVTAGMSFSRAFAGQPLA